MVQVVFSCRNGICKPGLSPYILCAVKGFNACGCHVQRPNGRTPEKLLQILAPSKCPIIDQICFEVKCLCHSSGKNKLTPDTTTATQGLRQGLWVCSCTNTSAFPASTQKVAAASVWATRNKTFMCPQGKALLWWDHSARLSWPHAYLTGTPWLHGLHREGWRGPCSRRAAELNGFLSSKNVNCSPFCLQMVLSSFLTSQRGPPGCSVTMLPSATYCNFQWQWGCKFCAFCWPPFNHWILLMLTWHFANQPHRQALCEGSQVAETLIYKGSGSDQAECNSQSLHSLSGKNMDTHGCLGV